MSPQSDTVANIGKAENKVNARDINIFNLLTNRIKGIADANIIGRDNIRVALP
jgi:hypothetical protein